MDDKGGRRGGARSYRHHHCFCCCLDVDTTITNPLGDHTYHKREREEGHQCFYGNNNREWRVMDERYDDDDDDDDSTRTPQDEDFLWPPIGVDYVWHTLLPFSPVSSKRASVNSDLGSPK